MFRNNVKIAFRMFKRDKQYAAINVFGLAIGLTIAMLIMLYGQYELSYENHNPLSHRVARITIDYMDGETLVSRTARLIPLWDLVSNRTFRR